MTDRPSSTRARRLAAAALAAGLVLALGACGDDDDDAADTAEEDSPSAGTDGDGTTGDGAVAPVMTGSHIDTVRTGGRYDGTLGVLAGLEVDTARMRKNLDLSGGLIMAEAVMLELGRDIGRQRAHDLVYDAVRVRLIEIGTAVESVSDELLAAEPDIAP